MPSDGFQLWDGRPVLRGEQSIVVGLKHLPIFLLAGHIVPIQIAEVNENENHLIYV